MFFHKFYLIIFGKFAIAAFLWIKISIKSEEQCLIHNRILFYFKITPGDALIFFFFLEGNSCGFKIVIPICMYM